MSEDTNVDLEALRKQVKDLTAERDSLQTELKDVRHEARDRRHEARGLAEQVAALTTERDRFKTAAEADPENLKKQLAEAQGKLRGLTHRQAFERVAKTLKVTDSTRLADLYALSGYQPEGDTPDDQKLTESIQGALKGRPWLVDSEPAPGGAPPAPGGATANGAAKHDQAGTAGPGADRGQSLTQPPSQAPDRIPGRL